ncbi:suppression of tumorigenicity 5 protein isoform x4 [Pitangus sulphuratus]|nr:suppression of tumorigenicity 5 protein isoform x4 [Pitangus sulphuratus]
MVKMMVGSGCPPAALGGPWWSRYPPAAPEGPHNRVGGCSEEAVTPWEACAEAGSRQDLWTHGERSPRWSRLAGRTCDPVGDPHWSSRFLKDCTPWKGPMLEQ